MPTAALSLSDAINQLRAELATAAEAGKGQALHFFVSKATIELTLGLTETDGTNVGGEVGIPRFFVLKGGASDTSGSQITHKVQLELVLPKGTKIASQMRGISDPE